MKKKLIYKLYYEVPGLQMLVATYKVKSAAYNRMKAEIKKDPNFGKKVKEAYRVAACLSPN
jgi:hypothetical protein